MSVSKLQIWFALILTCVAIDAIAADAPCPPAIDAEVPRRKPGMDTPTQNPVVCNPNRLPRVSNEEMPSADLVSDRWRLVDALGYRINWLDSYQGNNPLKGDRPIFGNDNFLNLSAVSGTLLEERHIGTADADGTRTLTKGETFFNQSLSLDAVLYRGDTVFRPPDYQWRFTTVLSESFVNANGKTVPTGTASIQGLSFEKHLRDISVHDDFDSMRVGIQPLTSDFRGFLLSDQPIAFRLFGTRDNNTLQYNIALFDSLSKNAINLNNLQAGIPHNEALLGNVYWQDFPRTGITSVFVAAFDHNSQPGMQQILGTVNAEALRAKHNYEVAYLGYGIDGHFGWLNATAMVYGELGEEQQGTFNTTSNRLQGLFAATELSVDEDTRRWKVSLLHASGDNNVHDRIATGFDGFTANPVFAGTDSSFFIHQALALKGGAFDLKLRNGLLPSLNPTNSDGEDNFSNPGLNLIGGGLDWDIAPKLRVSANINQLWFDKTGVLSSLTLRPIPRDFGAEFALNAFWRPFTNQNMILRISNAVLKRGAGYQALYDGGTPYSSFVFFTYSY